MINKERCFTVKEAAKLLGVSTATVKRRIKSRELITEERIGRRGLELVIPQRALNLEIMSFVPTLHQLTLSDFEAIVVKRFEAMAAGSDQRVSKALKELRKEYAQLTAELNGFQTVFSEAGCTTQSRFA
jgi:excisionase family DNA binding protein